MVVASKESDYADILYASDGPATTTGLLLVGMGSCLAPIGISVTVTVLWCQQPRTSWPSLTGRAPE